MPVAWRILAERSAWSASAASVASVASAVVGAASQTTLELAQIAVGAAAEDSGPSPGGLGSTPTTRSAC